MSVCMAAGVCVCVCGGGGGGGGGGRECVSEGGCVIEYM